MQKAKKKPIDKKKPSDFGVNISQCQTTYTGMNEPPKRQAGDKVEDVPALVEKLKKLGFIKG